MRTIKFRAWDKDDKVMIPWEQVGLNLLILQNLFTPKGDFIPLQFTGLKDKNEKEIYEGDIVKIIMQDKGDCFWQKKCIDKGVINFHEGNFAWLIEILGGRYQYLHEFHPYNKGLNFFRYPTGGKYRRTIEVIGNIYENPKLLK